MTSGDLRFDPSEKNTKVISTGILQNFQMIFTASFYLMISELDGGLFGPPHHGKVGSDLHLIMG